MTITSFVTEKSEAKALYIRENGIYLDSYFANDHLINVYSLNGYFVEVVINVRKSKIVDYITFESGFKRIKGLPFATGLPGKALV
jgi:hypothetical protein